MAVKRKNKSVKNQCYDELAKDQQKADADISTKTNEGAIYEDVNPYTLQSWRSMQDSN